MTTFGSQDIGYKEIKNTLNNKEVGYTIFDPPYSHHTSDDTYLNNSPGELRVESRISETTGGYAWVMRVGDTWGNDTHANQNNVENSDDALYYYQIDLSSGGNTKNYVSGVVTGGRRNGQYVTKWKFQYYHNNHWHWVDNGKIFNGNDDDSSEKNIIFSTPVYTVGIRFFPIATGNDNIASRMALLIDHEIFDPPYNYHTSNATYYALTDAYKGIGIGADLMGRLSESAYGGSGFGYAWVGQSGTNAQTGAGSWNNSLFISSNKLYYWQINVSMNNVLKKVAGVVVNRRDNEVANNQWVTLWNFTYSTDGSTWIDVPTPTDHQNSPYPGHDGSDQRIFIFFSEPILTTGIRFCPAGYSTHTSAKMALLMSKEVNASELNDYEEIFDPPYTHHSSNSVQTGITLGSNTKTKGKLSEMGNGSGWVPTDSAGNILSVTNDTEYWYQIDISLNGIDKRTVKGIVMKGKRNGNTSKQLKLQYSNDGNNWYWVDGGYTFTGNDDSNTNNFIYFTESVVTTGIRFFPTMTDPYLRMALILDNKLYSSALELSEPFNKKEVLDIEWGYQKGFTSILKNNGIHTLFIKGDENVDVGWQKNHLISRTSYPVQNNIYELSLKLMENTITSYFFLELILIIYLVHNPIFLKI